MACKILAYIILKQDMGTDFEASTGCSDASKIASEPTCSRSSQERDLACSNRVERILDFYLEFSFGAVPFESINSPSLTPTGILSSSQTSRTNSRVTNVVRPLKKRLSDGVGKESASTPQRYYPTKSSALESIPSLSSSSQPAHESTADDASTLKRKRSCSVDFGTVSEKNIRAPAPMFAGTEIPTSAFAETSDALNSSVTKGNPTSVTVKASTSDARSDRRQIASGLKPVVPSAPSPSDTSAINSGDNGSGYSAINCFMLLLSEIEQSEWFLTLGNDLHPPSKPIPDATSSKGGQILSSQDATCCSMASKSTRSVASDCCPPTNPFSDAADPTDSRSLSSARTSATSAPSSSTQRTENNARSMTLSISANSTDCRLLNSNDATRRSSNTAYLQDAGTSVSSTSYGCEKMLSDPSRAFSTNLQPPLHLQQQLSSSSSATGSSQCADDGSSIIANVGALDTGVSKQEPTASPSMHSSVSQAHDDLSYALAAVFRSLASGLLPRIRSIATEVRKDIHCVHCPRLVVFHQMSCVRWSSGASRGF